MCPPPPAEHAHTPNKKKNRPYTITKQRESWTDAEHTKFLEALKLYNREWKMIEAYVGTKTVIQIRSHAQKYFLKVQKLGTGEHVPPPRPKRKSLQPYPHKAETKTPRTSGGRSRSGSASSRSRSSGRKNASGAKGTAKAASARGASKKAAAAGRAAAAAAAELPPMQPTMPDFSVVYSLVSTMFGPACSLRDPLEEGAAAGADGGAAGAQAHGAPAGGADAEVDPSDSLLSMAPIDRETALLLLTNLTNNLQSREVWSKEICKLSSYGKQLLEADDPRSIPTRSLPGHETITCRGGLVDVDAAREVLAGGGGLALQPHCNVAATAV